MFGDVPLNEEFAANEYSCDVQDISTPLTLTDGKICTEEDELSSSERLQSEPNDILVQSKQSTTNQSSGSFSINAIHHEDDNHHLDSITTNIRSVPTAEKRHVCEHCKKEFRKKSR